MQPDPNELAKIATDAGVIDGAVDDFLKAHITEFDDGTGQIIHKATGLTAKAWLDMQREKKSYLFGTENDAQAELERKAFGEANVTARGVLVRGNPGLALARAKAWGLRDLNDYRKGTPPATGDDTAGKNKSKPAGNNPWRADQWNISKQGQLVKVMGLDGAARMAKAAGSYVGATRPNKAA